jgi:hypothetical protein
MISRANPEFFLGGGGVADPKATCNLFLFKNYIIKIVYLQHNAVCNCIYIHTNIITCSMSQSQCPIFLFFNFINLFFKILMR